HLIAAEDADWLLSLFQPMLVAFSRRRLGALGVDETSQDRALVLIRKLLDTGGPMTRTEICRRLAESGLIITAQTRYHFIRPATVSGLACLGPDRGRDNC